MITTDLESLGSIGAAALAVCLLTAASYGCGRLILRPLVSNRSPVDERLIALAIGLTLIAWLVAILGQLTVLSQGASLALLGAGGLLGAAAIALDIRQAVTLKRAPLLNPFPAQKPNPKATPRHAKIQPRFRAAADNRNRPQSRKKWAPLWWLLAAAAGLVTLGPALCYPTGWDELVYHHELPQRWLADGWPAVYRDLPYSGFPSLGELLFWLMAPLEGVIAPRLLTWVTWVVAIAAVYRLLRHRLALYAAATLTAAFALSGAALMIAANCYVESILLLNTATLSLSLDLRYPRSQAPAWERTSPRLTPRAPLYAQAAVIGILAGGAAAIKLTGLAIALLPCVWYALQAANRRLSPRHAISAATIYLLTTATIAFPFYLRPWLQTGNPFYPYYAHWFTTDPATLEMSRFHHGLGAAFGVHTPEALLTGPILLAFSADVYDGAFGWQLLILLALAVLAFVRWKPAHTNPTRQRGNPPPNRYRHLPFILWPALMAAGLYLFWFFTAQQARFAVAAALGLLLLAAYGLRQFRGTLRNGILVTLLAATVISLPYRNAGYYFGSWMAALGLISQADYVTVNTGGTDPSDQDYMPLIKALNEHLPPDAKLLILFEHRVFYMPCQTEFGTPFFQEANFTPPEEFATPERILARLQERNVTHVLLTNAPAGPDRLPPDKFDRLENFLPCFGQLTKQEKLHPIWQSNRYVLLEVNSNPAPAPASDLDLDLAPSNPNP